MLVLVDTVIQSNVQGDDKRVCVCVCACVYVCVYVCVCVCARGMIKYFMTANMSLSASLCLST